MTFEETMALLYLAKKLFPRDKSMGGSTRETFLELMERARIEEAKEV